MAVLGQAFCKAKGLFRMEKKKLAYVGFGVLLFALSLLLIGWLFFFFAAALNSAGINQLGVLAIFCALIFGIFYLFSIAMKMMHFGG